MPITTNQIVLFDESSEELVDPDCAWVVAGASVAGGGVSSGESSLLRIASSNTANSATTMTPMPTIERLADLGVRGDLLVLPVAHPHPAPQQLGVGDLRLGHDASSSSWRRRRGLGPRVETFAADAHPA